MPDTDTAHTSTCSCLRAMAWLPVIVILLGNASLSRASDTAVGDDLLEFVGLRAQMERSATTIIDETAGARTVCENDNPRMQDLATFLEKLYSPDTLRRSALEAIDSKLTVSEKAELHDWMQSPLGQKVYAAEATTENEELARMQQREQALVASPAWTEERQKRIYRVLRVTRVHDYVAALNASLTSVVKMASACKLDSDSLDDIETLMRRDRVDEKLIARMMLNGFVVPTGVVFEAFSDDELHEYFLFSATPAAQKWYGVVIDTVRSMLLDPVPELRQYLQRS